jgi:hypothetical protein
LADIGQRVLDPAPHAQQIIVDLLHLPDEVGAHDAAPLVL